jgi:hypothetical protein
MLTKIRKRKTLTVLLSALLIVALIAPQAALGLDKATSDAATEATAESPDPLAAAADAAAPTSDETAPPSSAAAADTAATSDSSSTSASTSPAPSSLEENSINGMGGGAK